MPDHAARKVALDRLADETETFAQFVREHQGMVFSMAFNSLRDRSLAEELAQDVFLELYRKLDSLESPAHVRHWLRKVTAHRCIDFSRRRKVRPSVGLDEVRESAWPAPGGDPLLDATLGRLVAALPEKARLVMILRYQEDLDPADIAEVLNMPVHTVKSHLRRSLEVLRSKMAAVGGGIHQ